MLLAAALVAGCGGDGGGEEESPRERLEAVLPDYERAVADQDCTAFARFAHSAVRPPGRKPDDPPDAEECRNLGAAYTQLADFKAERTEVYGNAAVVEGRIDSQLMALVWVVDVDGRWKQVQATPPNVQPQIGQRPAPGNRFVPNAEAFVRAMRAGDCRGAFRLLNPAAPFVQNETRGSFCKRFDRSFRQPGRFATQLTEAPGAEPVDLGGTRDFRFFEVDTGRGRRWVLILNTLPPALPPGGHADYSVLDYYPTGELEG